MPGQYVSFIASACLVPIYYTHAQQTVRCVCDLRVELPVETLSIWGIKWIWANLPLGNMFHGMEPGFLLVSSFLFFSFAGLHILKKKKKLDLLLCCG